MPDRMWQKETSVIAAVKHRTDLFEGKKGEFVKVKYIIEDLIYKI